MSDKKVSQEATIYQLKITLNDVKPPIWRRVQVPADETLEVVHAVIQIAMGWEDAHLHEFIVGQDHYGMPHPDYETGFGPSMQDEAEVTLETIATQVKSKFRYVYDFGDSWEHTIEVEKILAADPDMNYPVCIAGERACPPEDCGGPGGYADLLEALSDPKHTEHDDLLEWIGDEFDPEEFDLASVNDELADIDDYLDMMWLDDFELMPDLDEEEVTPEEMEKVRRTLKAGLRQIVEEAKETPEGYTVRFPGDPITWMLLAQFVSLEYGNDLTLGFTLELEPNEGPIRLHIKGTNAKQLGKEAFGRR